MYKWPGIDAQQGVYKRKEVEVPCGSYVSIFILKQLLAHCPLTAFLTTSFWSKLQFAQQLRVY